MPLTGTPAVLYMSTLMQGAKHGSGVNAARLRADALRAVRDAAARGRLRLAACNAGWRKTPGHVGFPEPRRRQQHATAVRPSRRRERRAPAAARPGEAR